MEGSSNLRALGPSSGDGYVAIPRAALEYLGSDLEQSQDEDEQLDLRAIWAALYRNRFLIAAIVAVFLAASVALALLTAPVYRASTALQIDQQAAKVLENQDQDPASSSQEADRFLQTQVDVMKSRSLAKRVAETLHLANDPNFLAAERLNRAGATPPKRDDDVVPRLQAGLSVDLPRNSRVVTLSFDSRDPVLAAKVANSYANNFITGNLQRKFDTSAYSRQFLEGQIAQTKERLENSEKAVIAYARAVGLIDASSGIASSGSAEVGPKSITTSNLIQLNQAYSQAQANRIQAQQRWATAAGTPALNLPDVLANPTVQQLSQQKALLQAQLDQDRQRYKEGHPSIAQEEAKIAEIDRQINTIAGSIKNSIREQYQVAARQESGLSGSVGELKGATLSEQDKSVRYNILKREADTNKAQYDSLLQRYRDISAAAGITMNNVSVIDNADVPIRPVWPKPLLNAAVGLLLGLLAALVTVFLREKFDDSVRSPADVTQKLDLPLLGTAPLIKSGAPVEALEDPRSLLSEAHYALRMSLELASDGGLPRSVLLTSSRPAEGKSTTAYGIARDLALSGKRVLLVDADLRKPSLHRLLALENRSGLANVLARQKPLEEAMQATSTENLFFVSSGPLPPNPAQLLAGKGLTNMLERAKQIFDLVILDGPPVLGLADAPRLATAAEATLFVVQANGAHRGQAKAALKRLLSTKAKLLGVILTKFDPKKAGYKNDYGYYYYEYSSTPEQLASREAA